MHTPGLWKRHDRIESTGSYLITDATGEVGIARVIAGTDAKDNAALIAAAPDMLAACKASLAVHRDLMRYYDADTTEHLMAADAAVLLKAAIAKAEGRNLKESA